MAIIVVVYISPLTEIQHSIWTLAKLGVHARKYPVPERQSPEVIVENIGLRISI
jgi:hypothetical protein